MFALVMAVFFAWSREKRGDGGLGWLESARRSNFATLVSAHQEAVAGRGGPPSATSASERASDRASEEGERRRRRAPGRLQRLPGPHQQAPGPLTVPGRDTPVGLSKQI